MLMRDFGKFAALPKKAAPKTAHKMEVGEIFEVLWTNGLGYSRCRVDQETNGQLKLVEFEEVWF
jgi:TusA-related sulfurtransferase